MVMKLLELKFEREKERERGEEREREGERERDDQCDQFAPLLIVVYCLLTFN